jgi:hypothetical protein
MTDLLPIARIAADIGGTLMTAQCRAAMQPAPQ